MTVGALGCDPGVPSGWDGTVVDSAGLRIVSSPAAPLWSPEEGWWVEEVVRVDPDEDVPETLFGYVADVDLDARGRLYALDQQAGSVRVFDSDGTFIRTLAGPGEGPGEIGPQASSVVVRGDTVVVVDWTQRRLQRYRTDGSPLSPILLPDELRGRGWLESGEAALWVRTLELTDEGEGWRSVDRLWRVEGGDAVAVLTFDYPESDIGARGAPRLPLVVNAPMWTVLPGGRLAWSTLEAAEVRIAEWIDEGPARPVGRWRNEGWRARPPSAADVRALRILVGERLEMLGGSAAAVDAIPVVEPSVLPVMTDLAAGPENTLWVQRTGDLRGVHPMATNTPDPPKGWGGATWDVLDGEGRYLGSVELPRRFRLMAFRGDLLVGAVADPRNVDALLVLRVNRPAAD